MSKELCKSEQCIFLRDCVVVDLIRRINPQREEVAVREEIGTALGIALNRNCPDKKGIKVESQKIIQAIPQEALPR